MHILAKEGEAAQVFSLFNELKNLGVQPTERHYGPVLSMCVNDREKFNALRAEARSLGFRLVPYWDTLVNVLLRQNDVPAALDTYRSLRPDAKRFDVLLINRLFQSLRRMGNISAIIEVYHLERDLGVFLPPSLMIHVIWAYAQQVDYHKAMSVFDTARNELKERTAAMPALQERYYKAELAMVRQALDITARQRDVELSLRYYLQVRTATASHCFLAYQGLAGRFPPQAITTGLPEAAPWLLTNRWRDRLRAHSVNRGV